MRAYFAFTRKELLESWRNYKLFIMIMVFVFFGMLAPFTAKITPKLLESLATEGLEIIMGEPTALDSWAQFFKNISQMGFIIVIIVFSGVMANEYNNGTFINILTKGLPRRTIILSKFTLSSILWTISYFVCFIICYLYTAYFWSNKGISNLLFSVFALWIFGILILSIILLGGVIFKSSYSCLLFTGGFIVTLLLLNIMPKLEKFNPIMLTSKNMALLAGDKVPKDLALSIIISIIIVIISMYGSVKLFNKKQV